MITKALAAGAVLAVAAGCASAPAPTTAAAKPTHYWVSPAKASENRYRVDNLACQSETSVAQGNTVFDPGTEAFDAYRDCMVSRGYVLRQY